MRTQQKKQIEELIGLLSERADIQGYISTDDVNELAEDFEIQNLSSVISALKVKGVDFFDLESDVESPSSPFEIAGGDSDDDDYVTQDSLSLYFKDMSKVPLLNKEEEVEIAIKIRAGEEATHRMQAELDLTEDKIRLYELKIQEAQGARDHLIRANTRLVISVAKKYSRHGVALIDLIQEGNLGLMKAVGKYDHTKGFRFSTYATWWIRQSITRSIADHSRTIRLPVHMSDRIRNIYKKNHELEQSLGRKPSSEELAEATGLTVKKLQWSMKVSWLPLSLESPVGDEEDSELGMFIEDQHTPTPQQVVYDNLLREKLMEVLNTLPPREMKVIKMRFGLLDGRAYTLEEVGNKFGLTRERIRQIEAIALRHLKHPKRTSELKEFY